MTLSYNAARDNLNEVLGIVPQYMYTEEGLSLYKIKSTVLDKSL